MDNTCTKQLQKLFAGNKLEVFIQYIFHSCYKADRFCFAPIYKFVSTGFACTVADLNSPPDQAK